MSCGSLLDALRQLHLYSRNLFTCGLSAPTARALMLDTITPSICRFGDCLRGLGGIWRAITAIAVRRGAASHRRFDLLFVLRLCGAVRLLCRAVPAQKSPAAQKGARA